MKLQQGQVWKCGEAYVRIVHLERLEVGYKSASNPGFSDGKHQHTSKKDFCRLLKGATLVSPVPPALAKAGQAPHACAPSTPLKEDGSAATGAN